MNEFMWNHKYCYLQQKQKKKQDPYVNGTEGVCLKICMEYGITTSHRKFEGAIQDKLR